MLQFATVILTGLGYTAGLTVFFLAVTWAWSYDVERQK